MYNYCYIYIYICVQGCDIVLAVSGYIASLDTKLGSYNTRMVQILDKTLEDTITTIVLTFWEYVTMDAKSVISLPRYQIYFPV